VLLVFTALVALCSIGTSEEIHNPYTAYFDKAYQAHPEVPKGVLEAIAYTNTRFHHVTHSQDEDGSDGRPLVYGVMGLVLDGKGYFKNSLTTVSRLSGYRVENIMSHPEINIMAFAAAYARLLKGQPRLMTDVAGQVPLLKSLCELPEDGVVRDFALDSHLYSVLSFMNSRERQDRFAFPKYDMDLVKVFGEHNFKVLSSKRVLLGSNSVQGDGNVLYKNSAAQAECHDFPGVRWVAAHPSNYTVGRNGTRVSAVVVHDTEGSYAGAISWQQNPSANVAAHYTLRSSDGQITQMVCEADKGWHVGSENPYTIGLEHEGFYRQEGWFTEAMYQSSAALVRDICRDHNIDCRTAYAGPPTNGLKLLPDSIRIKGHQHYRNQTHVDPGLLWDWARYYALLNPEEIEKPKGPYSGSPIVLPGKVEAEHYDYGGQDVSFNESDPVDMGGLGRPFDGVDIATSGNQSTIVVGYIEPGEWLEYTVRVEEPGRYRLNARAATMWQNSPAFHVEFNGRDMTGPLITPLSENWHTYSTVVSEDVELDSGEQVMRVVFDSGGLNLDYMELEYVAAGVGHAFQEGGHAPLTSMILHTGIGGELMLEPGIIGMEVFDVSGRLLWSHVRPEEKSGRYAVRLPSGLDRNLLYVRFLR
jgi:N-acetyl-anhydromuramyl-L-alanine amidase AmpD